VSKGGNPNSNFGMNAVKAKTLNEDETLTFANSDFKDSSDNVLSKIKITGLVSNGKLQLSGVDVTLNQEITDSDYTNLVYVPTANYNGDDSFEFQPYLNDAYDSAQTQALKVNSVNDAPTISGSATTSVVKDTAYSFTPTVVDIDTTSFTFSITNKPSWASFDTTSGALTGTPTVDNIGTTDNIVISVNDGGTTVSLSSFNLKVTARETLGVLEAEATDLESVIYVQKNLRFSHIKGSNVLQSLISTNLNLITQDPFGKNSEITWSTSDKVRITSNGTVSLGDDITTVALTATIYKGTASKQRVFYIDVAKSGGLSDAETGEKEIGSITFDSFKGDNIDTESITSSLSLPSTTEGSTAITWSVYPSGVIDVSDGSVTRGAEDKKVMLKASISINGTVTTKEFPLQVLKAVSSENEVSEDAKLLSEKYILGTNKSIAEVITALNLPTTGRNGSTITWTSSDETSIESDGTVTRDENNKLITLTATLSKGGVTEEVSFVITVMGIRKETIGEIEKTAVFKSSAEDESDSEVKTITTTFTEDGSDKHSIIIVDKDHREEVGVDGESIVSTVDINTSKNTTIKNAKIYQNGNGSIEGIIEIADSTGKKRNGKIGSLLTESTLKVEDDGSMEMNTTIASGAVAKAKVTTDGLMEHVFVKDGIETVATSQIPSTDIIIGETGEITTTVNTKDSNDEATYIEAKAKIDGTAVHKVSNNTKNTTATFTVVGAKTLIDSDSTVKSEVDTAQTLTIGDKTVKTVVSTTADGESLTWFELDGGVFEQTVSSKTPLESGSDINISTNSDGKLQFEIRTKVSRSLIIE
jgi:hypothetical protein